MRAHLKSKHLTEHAIVDQHQKQQQAKEVPLKKSCPNESDTTVTTEHKKLKQKISIPGIRVKLGNRC